MDALTKTEYPAMLERLPPVLAATKFKERVQKIGKVNADIADWMQERRKVEDIYAASLRKLSKRPLDVSGPELGIFEHPWSKISNSMREIAASHETLSKQIEKDIEQPLRNFTSTNPEYSGIPTLQGNLGNMARELEEAQGKSDKLSKKGGKANAAKVDQATQALQAANSQWEVQAPFVFEKLQSLDETRLNKLRDLLTQYETLESDKCGRDQAICEGVLGVLVEIETSTEIISWSQASTAGRPITERHARQLSNAGRNSINAGSIASNTGTMAPPPQTPRSTRTAHTDNASERTSEHSNPVRPETSGDSAIKKSRFGTMLNRRRQSIHGGFNRASSPSRGNSGSGSGFPSLSSLPSFGRSSSRDGRRLDDRPTPSPRASSNNLRASPAPDNRLSALPESPGSPMSGTTNGFKPPALISDSLPGTNGTGGHGSSDLSDVQPPPGPPPSQLNRENTTDSQGFTIPSAMNDPISQAQMDAADENDQPQFKVDIKNEPIPEQDADAQAALSSVANTLRSAQAVTPSRKVGTIRGRRDVRQSVFLPQGSLDVATQEHIPPSPGIPTIAGSRAATLAALSEGQGPPSASDTTSIRSGRSLTHNVAAKHADMHQPGLNASIIETISAIFEDGEAKTAKISGEVALIYNGSDFDSSPAQETIRINNFPKLEAIGPNRTFLQTVSEDKPDEFTINLSAISKSSIAFTYKVHVEDEDLTSNSPLLLRTMWRPQEDKLGMIIEYKLNPTFGGEMQFHNLVILGFSTGPRAISCQTKPSGTQYKDKSLVVWQLGDVVLKNEWQRIICRLNGVKDAAPEIGHIEARWEVLDAPGRITLSRLDTVGKGKGKEESNPFDDESGSTPTATTPPVGHWVPVETSQKVVSGKYETR